MTQQISSTGMPSSTISHPRIGRTPMTRRDDVVGCYDPAFEHDSCGVAFVVDLERPASHRVVTLGLTALENLAHRGAFGADPGTGDGAGALIQLPHRLYSEVAGFDLPGPGRYGPGMAFLPCEPRAAQRAIDLVSQVACEEGLQRSEERRGGK